MQKRSKTQDHRHHILFWIFKRAAWACSMRSSLGAITTVFVHENSNRGGNEFNIFPASFRIQTGGPRPKHNESSHQTKNESKLDSNWVPGIPFDALCFWRPWSLGFFCAYTSSLMQLHTKNLPQQREHYGSHAFVLFPTSQDCVILNLERKQCNHNDLDV